MWLLLLTQAFGAMSCDEVVLLVRSDVPRANILYTLTQAQLQEGAAECLLRKGVPQEYIDAALAKPKPPAPRTPETVIIHVEPEAPPAPPPPAILQYRVDVEVVGLQIGAAKTGGQAWDGTETIQGDKLTSITHMIANGVAPDVISSRVAEWGGQGKDAPDPIGFVELLGPNTPDELKGKRLPLDKRSKFAKDTYNPRYKRSYGFHGLTLAEGDALQVTVEDMEFQDKEMIGIAELPFKALAYAFEAQQVTPIHVGDQTDGQLLYVLVSVRPSSLEGPPEAVGPLF